MQRKRKRPMGNDTNAKRGHVMSLLASGLILQNEAAELAGVTRQRVHQWVQAEGVHAAMARKRYLRTLMDDN